MVSAGAPARIVAQPAQGDECFEVRAALGGHPVVAGVAHEPQATLESGVARRVVDPSRRYVRREQRRLLGDGGGPVVPRLARHVDPERTRNVPLRGDERRRTQQRIAVIQDAVAFFE